MAKFYISDLHFSHANAITFDNRPWKNIVEMNNEIIHIWNKRITDADEVYILGDISWTNAYETRCLIAQLRGKKYWITGNHDSKLLGNEELRRQFVEVYEGYHKLYDGDKTVILSHYPILMYDGIRRNNVHLYGHIHNNKEDCELIAKWKAEYEKVLNIDNIPMYNVGIMVSYMEWGPKTLKEILEVNE